MTNVAKALYGFWSTFGLPAYPEGNVPSDADLPYITYTLTQPEWQSAAIHQARVWMRSESYAAINAKVDEITARIGSGILLAAEPGYLCIRKGNPLVQFQDVGAPDLKVAYLNLQLNAYTE